MLTAIQLEEFKKAMELFEDYRRYYVRVVLLDANRNPIGVSNYVSPQKSTGEGVIEISPNTFANQVTRSDPPNLPDVEVIGYDPPKFSAGTTRRITISCFRTFRIF